MATYDMRNPSKPGYADTLQVTVRRRSLLERLRAVAWLLCSNWRDAP